MRDIEASETFFLFAADFDVADTGTLLEAWVATEHVESAQQVREVTPDEGSTLSASYESVSVTVKFGQAAPEELPDLPWISLALDETYFRPEQSDAETRRCVGEYAECVRDLYLAAVDVGTRPVAAVGLDPNQLAALHGDHGGVALTREGILEGKLEQLFWLQMFPPTVVDDVGLEHLLDTPAWRVEQLSDGGVLVVSYPDPHFPENTTAIAEHLGVPLETYWV